MCANKKIVWLYIIISVFVGRDYSALYVNRETSAPNSGEITERDEQGRKQGKGKVCHQDM